MTISEMIAELEKVRAMHGDLSVMVSGFDGHLHASVEVREIKMTAKRNGRIVEWDELGVLVDA